MFIYDVRYLFHSTLQLFQVLAMAFHQSGFILEFATVDHIIQFPFEGGYEKVIGYSSSLVGAIVPPANSICSLKVWRILGSVEVLGSISLIESILIARRFALCFEPKIEYAICSAASFDSAGRSRLNLFLTLPNGATPDTRYAFIGSATCMVGLNFPSRNNQANLA